MAVFTMMGVPMDPAAVPAEPIPPIHASAPFLSPGTGVLIHGTSGGGRSSLIQAIAYDLAMDGKHVLYLGGEVKLEEFHGRSQLFAATRGHAINDELRTRCARVHYESVYDAVILAQSNPMKWREEGVAEADVVIFDPLSDVASALDLDFSSGGPDFERWYARTVQPLVAAGRLVVLLDNVGHTNRDRAAGAAAKEWKVDLRLACAATTDPVGLSITVKKVRSSRASVAVGDRWVFDKATQRIEAAVAQGTARPFRPTVFMERISRYIEDNPGCTVNAIREQVKGKSEHKAAALKLLKDEGYVAVKQNGKAYLHRSNRPYHQAGDPAAATVYQAPTEPRAQNAIDRTATEPLEMPAIPPVLTEPEPSPDQALGSPPNHQAPTDPVSNRHGGGLVRDRENETTRRSGVTAAAAALVPAATPRSAVSLERPPGGAGAGGDAPENDNGGHTA